MASKSLGTLTLDLVANIGGYTAGLDKAEKEAAKRAKAIENAFDKAAVGVGVAFGLMATAAVGAFSAINKGIDEAAKFQDLADMTGAAAEEIAGLQVAASTAGVSIEEVAGSMNKLSKGLVGVDDESKAAGAALKNLGINVDDFKKLDPVAQYEKVSKALAGFADGAGKTTTAMALFGKTGADQLKVMKALEEQGGRNNILTKEQIALADDFSDKQAKSRAELTLYASALTTQAIPAMTAITGAIKDLIKEFVNGSKAQSDFALNLTILDWAEKVALAVATVGEALVGLGKALGAVGGSFQSVFADLELASKLPVTVSGVVDFAKSGGKELKAALDNRNKVAADANQKYIDLWNYDGTAATKAIQKSFANQKAVIKNMQDPEIRRLLARSGAQSNPGLPVLQPPKPVKTGGGGGAKDDPTKKLLDNDLAYFKAQQDAAKDLLSDRNRMLELYNQQGLLSVKDYYGAQQTILDEATQAQAKAIDDQIAALEKFKAAASKSTDVADTQGKINKLEEEKAKLYKASGQAAIESSFKQVQAQKAVQDAFNEVNAKVLEYQGNLRAAGEIRFDAQNEKLIAQAQAEGNTEIVKRIELLKQYTLAQADINKLQSQFSLAQGDLSIAEERITQARERGTMGEIESLRASGDARKQAIAVMEKQLAVFQALDAASRTPEQEQAIERLKVQLEGLRATVDPLADKFNTMLGDEFGSAWDSYISGAKSAKEATKDFFDNLTKQLLKMAIQDIGKSFFGGGGASTGGVGFNFGSVLSSLFGSGGGSSDVLGDFIKAGGYASGGFTGAGAANDPAGIVHKGEYVLTADQTRKIGVGNLDNGNFGGGFQQSNTFVVEGRIDRSTQTQLATKVRAQTNTAAARFA